MCTLTVFQDGNHPSELLCLRCVSQCPRVSCMCVLMLWWWLEGFARYPLSPQQQKCPPVKAFKACGTESPKSIFQNHIASCERLEASDLLIVWKKKSTSSLCSTAKEPRHWVQHEWRHFNTCDRDSTYWANGKMQCCTFFTFTFLCDFFNVIFYNIYIFYQNKHWNMSLNGWSEVCEYFRYCSIYTLPLRSAICLST